MKTASELIVLANHKPHTHMRTKPILLLSLLLFVTALFPIGARAQGGGDKKQKDVEVKCPAGSITARGMGCSRNTSMKKGS